VDGECEIELKDGTKVRLRGCWEGDDGESAILCIPDSGNSPYCDGALTQFDDVIAGVQSENGCKRILTVGFDITHDKQPDKFVDLVVKVMDYLGVMKPTFLGRDAGALILVALKLKVPKRVGRLLLENKRDDMKEKAYKKMLKKDPGCAMGAAYAGPWMLLMVLTAGGKCDMKGFTPKKFGKTTTILWPYQAKGRPTKKEKVMGLMMMKASLGAVKTVDTFGWGAADYAAILASPQ
jgi:pimeloyl-ACP methyl ester carboxylesterase